MTISSFLRKSTTGPQVLRTGDFTFIVPRNPSLAGMALISNLSASASIPALRNVDPKPYPAAIIALNLDRAKLDGDMERAVSQAKPLVGMSDAAALTAAVDKNSAE